MDRIRAYRWPGNIRELENILERAVILSSGSVLTIDADTLSTTSPPDNQPVTSSGNPNTNAGARELLGLENVERNHILSVLRQTEWVIEGPRGAARILDLHPNTLRSRLKKMGISRASHELS